jgi:hypothetical protein
MRPQRTAKLIRTTKVFRRISGPPDSRPMPLWPLRNWKTGHRQYRRFEVPALLAANAFRNFKSKSGTGIIYLLVEFWI